MIEIYAAVDILDGKCVRLTRGEASQATVYGDPLEMAQLWSSQGCDWLHVVDLDGAFEGKPVNAGAIREIVGAANVPVQVGGGLRDPSAWSWALGTGCKRVVVGSAALSDPESVVEATQKYPGRLALGLDVRGSEVATEGWVRSSGATPEEVIERLSDARFGAVVVTDVSRDGIRAGANIALVEKILAISPWPVVASGGISSPEDLEALRSLELRHPRGESLVGVVIGRALYEGDLSIAEARTALGG